MCVCACVFREDGASVSATPATVRSIDRSTTHLRPRELLPDLVLGLLEVDAHPGVRLLSLARPGLRHLFVPSLP